MKKTKLFYRGTSVDRHPRELPPRLPDEEVVGVAIFQLRYRGTCYWICRHRTQNGATFDTRIIPANSVKSDNYFS